MNNFNTLWHFKSPGANDYRVPKSAPAVDAKRLYVGSDSGFLYALDQETGSIIWTFKVGFPSNKKSIFSSPLVYKGRVYFGAYDGNVYCLAAENGILIWKYNDADWIGSSPTLSIQRGVIYIGLEYGLFGKQGGIAALDLDSGKQVWKQYLPGLVHGTPGYDPRKDVVVIGGEDRTASAFNGKNGEKLWQYQTEGSIKATPCFDTKRDLVFFGSMDTHIYGLNTKTGKLVIKYKTGDEVWSTPAISGNTLFTSSSDKRLYAMDLESHLITWVHEANGRILSSPYIFEDSVFIGSNDGTFRELSTADGTVRRTFRTTECITNRPAYNPDTKTLFVPTYANEIYALR